MEKIIIKRIVAGYYSFTYKGYLGTITKVEGEPNWYFQLEDDYQVGDWQTSYSEAKLAAIEYIDYLIESKN